MKRGLQAQLYLRFPKLFKGRNQPHSDSLMEYGIMCGDGWYELIYRLCDDLEKMAKKEDAGMPEIVQVKQKYGSLCIYCDEITRSMYERIKSAEHESVLLCEVCGDKADRVGGGGWDTRCEKHLDE